MADKVIIEGCRPYDGEYELDLADEPLNILERRWIKKISGYVGAAVWDGWVQRDPDIELAIAVIAMRRVGKIEKSEVLRAAEVLEDGATIRLVFETIDEEAEEGPPVEAPDPSSSSVDSGGRSSQTSDRPGQIPSPTGTPALLKSVISAPETLAS